MEKNIAIKVEGLVKKYIIGHQRLQQNNSLRDVITYKSKYFLKNLLKGNRLVYSKEEFSALNNINFSINKGERVGIIGRNGAGKSTLLKILSRITDPTEGRISIRGRVASLLEVGTGFHPELTGRENIFLNGAILGMSRHEIRLKFEEIVSFADIEKFLDTPVKRYSSGMYVRLAFAVAAHLEPEVLIIDEVLAVGDSEFQRKCLGKIDDASKDGKTIIVVSHQMPLISNLCSKCFLLEGGKVVNEGPPEQIIPQYLNINQFNLTQWRADSNQFLDKSLPYFLVKRFAITDHHGIPLASNPDASKDAYIIIEGDIKQPDRLIILGFKLYDEYGNLIIDSAQTDQKEEHWPYLSFGPFSIRTKLDLSILNEGRYRLDLMAGIHCVSMIFTNEISISFEIVGNLSKSPYWVGRKSSIIAPALRWENF